MYNVNHKHKALLVTDNNFLAEGVVSVFKYKLSHLKVEVIKITHEDFSMVENFCADSFKVVFIDIPPPVFYFGGESGSILRNRGVAMKISPPSILKKIKIIKPNKKNNFSFECLSQKQIEFLSLVLRGATERTISKVMNISVKTVSAHGRNVRIKMGLENRNHFLQFVNFMRII